MPLLTWYASLAVGILAGTIIKEYRDHLKKIYSIGLWGGLSLLFGFVVGCHYYDLDIRILHALYQDAFYRQTFFHFLYNTLIIIVEISLLYLITGRQKKEYYFLRFLRKKSYDDLYCAVDDHRMDDLLQALSAFEPGLEMSVVAGLAIAGVSILIAKASSPFQFVKALTAIL